MITDIKEAEKRVNIALTNLLMLDEKLALRFSEERESYLQDKELQQDCVSMVGNLDALTKKIEKAIKDKTNY